MSKESGDPQPPIRQCSSWTEIAEHLDWFAAPEISCGPEGEGGPSAWVFRGLGSSHYELQPSIERDLQTDAMDWHAREHAVSEEFKARAGLHLNASLIPGDELSWLALMQHYGVPTRLLDFTYSPFIALYFAVRDFRAPRCRSGRKVRLWAIDLDTVNDKFKIVARRAKGEPARVGIGPEDQQDERDALISATEGVRQDIEKFLPARGNLKRELNKNGCVCAIAPRVFNPRLASQQGVFMLNLAGDLRFDKSLVQMMEPTQTCSSGKTRWCKTFDIAVKAIPEIERKLFRMNIHEQSLFPGMQGLVGVIKQSFRLHWNRPRNAGA